MTREEMLALIVGQRIVSVDLEGPDDSLPDALSVDSNPPRERHRALGLRTCSGYSGGVVRD